MPEFTVIAGPNGAGKSTFSARLSPPAALVFDPDLQNKYIERQYPDISEEALETAVTNKYHDLEKQAMRDQLHFSVETNLRNEFLAERALVFRQHGYRLNLVFMLLPDITSSMDRVNLRVKQKGHYVDPDSIRHNFKAGLENLLKLAPLFDNVMLVCAAAAYGIVSPPAILMTIKDRQLSQLHHTIPRWAAPVIRDIRNLLTTPPPERRRSQPAAREQSTGMGMGR